MTTKDELHRLVDQLPESQIETAARDLRELCAAGDPVLRALLTAPSDDEPLTAEDRAAIAEGWDAYRAGDVVSLEEVKRELGL